ncbi:hypothetical protein E5676_scaffold374G00150 [Cucumis melo var. makuwa]|uniref:Uncharacterized protein n=1 Tax=Cucumis melo var. makuwa TaxID=1194695 RepID=A0A5D3BTV1_CUCMM|nr:hypothetical protein E5676_scaffold374G00150 [Cucumis melo var. makuwa]
MNKVSMERRKRLIPMKRLEGVQLRMELKGQVQPINPNPSRANEKMEPLVQDLDSVLKGTTYLLSQKWVGVNSVLHPMSLAIHSVLPLKWKAYWANDDELPSPMQI